MHFYCLEKKYFPSPPISAKIFLSGKLARWILSINYSRWKRDSSAAALMKASVIFDKTRFFSLPFLLEISAGKAKNIGRCEDNSCQLLEKEEDEGKRIREKEFHKGSKREWKEKERQNLLKSFIEEQRQ